MTRRRVGVIGHVAAATPKRPKVSSAPQHATAHDGARCAHDGAQGTRGGARRGG